MDRAAQQTEALNRANMLRSIRAQFKRQIAAQDRPVGLAMVREAIAAPEPEIEGMRPDELLRSVRHRGDGYANRILTRAHVSPRRRLGELTDNERQRLDGALR